MDKKEIEQEKKTESKPKPDLECLKNYEKKYNGKNFLNNVKNYARSLGLNTLYKAVQLYYVLQKPEVPHSTKLIIYGALGYLLAPLDLIPDITPLIGYSDDVVAIGLAFAQILGYIDEDVNNKSKMLIDNIFGAGTSDDLK